MTELVIHRCFCHSDHLQRKMQLFIIFAVLLGVNCAVDVEKYLQQFGYHNPNNFDGGSLTESIKTFQRTFGLTPTGVADEQTTKLMTTPRCGLKDHAKNAFADSKWSKKDLTYYYNNYTPDLSSNAVERLTTKAFKFWSDVTPLTFTKRSGAGDIVISFGSRSHHDGKRTCGYPFDGQGGVLAHAFFPPDGRLHFDEDEHYTSESSSGTNYLWVATHELGHILGLEHDTQTKDAVMYPYYRPYNPNGMKLHTNDIYRIQRQYGRGTGGGGPNTQPPITIVPTQSGCTDILSDCYKHISKCNYNTDWRNYLTKYCKKTCNKCGACKDEVTNCADYVGKCKDFSQTWTDYMKKYCKSTCSYC